MATKIQTIEDLMALTYSPEVGGDVVRDAMRTVAKTDAPVITTTTGVYNAVYGAEIWRQLNEEINAFGALPKTVWDRSGWRVITARGASSGGGVAENASLPDTVKPTFATLSTKPKQMFLGFEVSALQDKLAQVQGDDSIADMVSMREVIEANFKELLNIALLGDANSTAGYNLESIDRVAAAYSEVALVDANDLDIYSQDRDAAASWTDAYVSHNSGTDRDLTDTLIRTAIATITENSGQQPEFILTGVDHALKTIPGLYDAQLRYHLSDATVKMSVNGVQTLDGASGTGVGIRVASLYGLPVLHSKNVVKDTTSRVYFLNTRAAPGTAGKPQLHLKTLLPTTYFESGLNKGDPIALGKFGNEGGFLFMGELICHNFKAQGKIRDLK